MSQTGKRSGVPLAGTRATLDAQARECLLVIARRAVEAAACGVAAPVVDDAWLPSALREPGAAFVTLHVDGALRGCLGALEPRGRTLAEIVAGMASAASREDPRFAPLQHRDLPALHIEISVLGPMLPVADPAEVVVGRDGVVIEAGDRRGLLLPQVAIEWGWDREALLGHACLKAGLATDAWKQGARILRFEAEVFGEPRPSPAS
jgi:AmmeMemoRadiSam system protein A